MHRLGMPKPESRNATSSARRLSTLGFFAVLAVWVTIAAGLKLSAARSGAYTADLYDFHQSLRSTVDGEFFQSYVWGNVMGDHGYLFFFLLLPLYWIDPAQAFWALVVVGPLTIGAASWIIRSVLVRRGHRHPSPIALGLVAFPGMFLLAHEPVFGFHPDMLAGPLLAVAAIALSGRTIRLQGVEVWIGIGAFFLFALLKEEMAVLAVIFGIPFLLDRGSRRLGQLLTGTGVVVAVGSFALIEAARTPFNRGNTFLLRSLLDELRLAIQLPGVSRPDVLYILVPVTLGAALVYVILVNRRRLMTVDISVGMVVAAKLVTLALVYPYLPGLTWHFVIPLTGAWYALYRFSSLLPELKRNARVSILSGTLALLVSAVLLVDVRWYSGYSSLLEERRNNAADARVAMESFAPIVDNHLVTVPIFDIHSWRNGDVVSFTGGGRLSPSDISDFIVTSSEGLPPDLRMCFELRDVAASRSLYVRRPDCPANNNRQLFEHIGDLP